MSSGNVWLPSLLGQPLDRTVNRSNFDLTRSHAGDSLFAEGRHLTDYFSIALKELELWQRILTLSAAWQLMIGLLIKSRYIRAEPIISAVRNAKGSSIKIRSSISAKQLQNEIGRSLTWTRALKLDAISNLRQLPQQGPSMRVLNKTRNEVYQTEHPPEGQVKIVLQRSLIDLEV